MNDQRALKLSDALKQAFAAYEHGRLPEADKLAREILRAQPDNFDALNLIASLTARQGLLAESLAIFDRALMVRPDHADALSNRGIALQQLKRFDEALASYDRALAVRPDHAGTLNNRGDALRELDRLDEALESYDRALALRPHQVELLGSRGMTLHRLKRFDEALASYDRALALQPDHADALNSRGTTLHELKRLDDALASYDRALAVRPDHAGALNNRGVALFELRRLDEALVSYDCALALQPDNAELHFNKSMIQLLKGDYAAGWREYEWRRKGTGLEPFRRDFAAPSWLGKTEIADKTILLHSEQGFGDTLQFCRYVPLVADRGARVLLGVQAPLKELMASLPGVAQVISASDKLPHFDLHCPLLSLPLAFGTRLASIPANTPYLAAPAESITRWSLALGPRRRPRVGLVWSGKPTHRNDANRSIQLRSLLPLLDVDADFVSLQRDVCAADAMVLKDRSDVIQIGDRLDSFTDTAAVISNLDLVISVDTAVGHLAGALAKPVWLLLPFLPDFRWLLDRDDSPWYPTARLFRQDARGDWSGVIGRVAVELEKAIARLQ